MKDLLHERQGLRSYSAPRDGYKSKEDRSWRIGNRGFQLLVERTNERTVLADRWGENQNGLGRETKILVNDGI